MTRRWRHAVRRAGLGLAATAALGACASPAAEPPSAASVSLRGYLGRPARVDAAASLRAPPPLRFRVYAAPGGVPQLDAESLAAGRSGAGAVEVPAGDVAVVVDVTPPELVGPFRLAPGQQAVVRLMDFPAARPARRIWRVERADEPVAHAFPPPQTVSPLDASAPDGRAAPLAAGMLAGFPGALRAAARPVEDATPGYPPTHGVSAREVLRRAFDNLYGCDLQERVRFQVSSEGGRVLRYRAQRLRKRIDGRIHEIWSVTDGSDRRDYRMLRIEGRDRVDDTFAYIPELLRVRRLTTAQRGDLFFGSDVTLEELEVFDVERFEFVGRASGTVQGEPAHLVTVQPLRHSGFDRADFLVSQRDHAVLQMRLYRPGALDAYKITRMPRAEMEEQRRHVLPRHIVFEHLERGTRTDVFFESRVVDPELPDAFFGKSALESRRRLIPARRELPQ